MGSQGIFRAVFGRKGVSEVFTPRSPEADALHPALKAELQRLDLLKSGLGRKAIHYVTTGERGDLFGQLLAMSTASHAVRKPFEDTEPRIYTLQKETDTAVVTGEIAPGPVVLRTLELRLAAARKQTSWSYSPRPVETSITALSGMLNAGLRNLEVQYKVDWSRAITVDVALAHFEACAGDITDLFVFLLQRGEAIQLVSHPGCWAASETAIGFYRSHPAALAGALAKVAPNLRAGALRLIEQLHLADMPKVEAQLVAMFTKPYTKEDRERAISTFARFDPELLAGILERHLATGDADTRHALVQAAGRAPTLEIVALLEARAKVEKTARVQAAIAAVLEVEAAGEALAPVTAGEDGTLSYLAVTGETIACPPRIDTGVAEVPPPSDQACITFFELLSVIQDVRCKRAGDYNKRYNRQGSNVQPVPRLPEREVIEAAFATLTQAAPLPPYDSSKFNEERLLVNDVRAVPEGQAWLRSVLAPLSVAARLRIMYATRPSEVQALIGASNSSYPHEVFGTDLLREWVAEGLLDLRNICTADHLRGLIAGSNQRYRYGGRDSALDAIEALPGDALWPWLAESMEVLDEALGLAPAKTAIPLDRSMRVLAMLPAVPQRYLPRLTEIAVAEKRHLRLLAMELLREAKDLPARIEALLDDKRQPVRINAAGWLADIRSAASEKALRARLKKEKSDPVRAALIIALQRLGVDLADVIGPASLIAEAEKANTKTPPKLPAWLVANRLPQVRFKDGATVPQSVVEYWLALAIRLKDPGAHGQFGIYLDQLVPEDARALSGWVLESWIAYDTSAATLEEAATYAKANYTNSLRWYCSSKTPADQAAAIAELTREKMGELVNSGSDTKGLLALTCRADAGWAAGRVRWFLKKHGRRSHQAMALLEALAGTGAPAALQVVIAASVRLKQKTTQARAAEIAQRYADDRGWSVDELADRTVPSAGFDDDGELELPCGEDSKPYVARLDAALAIHLFNPDGKPIKALPAGDDENSKESKKAFSAAKKELGQIVTLQGERLFEAMCLERAWPVADWRMAFHAHPVMRRLVERLVWQGLDAEGQPLGLFRPTQEGDFTDAADSDVAIDSFAAVRLAHGALVDAETCQAWARHLKDYEVKPFIAQFDNVRAPLTPEQGEEAAITDRQGWAAESRALRGAAEKRGYQRVMGDGGGCHEYVKEFRSQGITATIWHTGSYAVDDNNRVALKELRFTKDRHRGAYRLKDVPPVMLAECWADYHAVAAKGAFDPDWEKISPW